MKRDPRLRRLGERRSARHLHGLRFTPASRLLRSLGMLSRRHQQLTATTVRATASWYALRQAFIDNELSPWAKHVATDLTEQLRRDGALFGEAHVAVGWDDALDQPTYTRIPPGAVHPSAIVPWDQLG